MLANKSDYNSLDTYVLKELELYHMFDVLKKLCMLLNIYIQKLHLN